MTEAAKLRDKYSTHAICDALQIDRGTFYNHIFRSKGENFICDILDLYSRKAIAHRISLRNSTHLVLLTLRAAC